MILRSIELEAFGRFSRRTFEFRRGLNLVVGPNETGKSTLMESVPSILFGVRDKQRFVPWGRSGSCRATLQFETGGGSVRVQRDLLSDEVSLEWTDELYQTRKQVAGKASPQGRSGEKKAYLQELQDLLGIRDPDLFRATLFFGQGDLSLDFGKSLSERIKALLSGSADIDYDQVLNELSGALFDVTCENPWGKDKTRDRQLELTEKELFRLNQLLQSGEAAGKELAELEEQLRKLEEALATEREELSQGEKYLQWVRNYWQLHGQRRQLEESLATQQSLQTKRKDLFARQQSLRQLLVESGLQVPADIDASRVPEHLQEARRALLQLQHLQGEQQQLRTDLLAPDGRMTGACWLWTLLVILVAGGAAWRFPELQLHCALGATLLTLPVWIWKIWKGGKKTARRSELRGKAQLLEQQQRELQGQLDALEGQLAATGLNLQADQLEKQIESWSRHHETLQGLRDVDSALAVLPSAEDLEESCQEILRELALIDQRQRQGRALRDGVDLDAGELDEAEQKLEGLRQIIQKRESQRDRLWQRRAECTSMVGGRAQLEEERQDLLEEVTRLQRRKRILSLSCQVVRDAVKDFRSTYLERFSSRVGPYLEAFSNGAYRSLRLGDDFSIELQGAQGGWKPLGYFSQGTRDAVALSVRLAFVDQFSHGRNLPVLLDDALVNLDSSRQTRVLKLLKTLSVDHQIILFSHDERLAKRAARERWHVLPLEGKTQLATNTNREEEHVGQLHLL